MAAKTAALVAGSRFPLARVFFRYAWPALLIISFPTIAGDSGTCGSSGNPAYRTSDTSTYARPEDGSKTRTKVLRPYARCRPGLRQRLHDAFSSSG